MFEGTGETIKTIPQEGLSIEERYKNYKAKGGIFGEALFRNILESTKSFDINELNPTIQTQALNLAKIAGIPGTAETTILYGLLRKRHLQLSKHQLEDKDGIMLTSSDQDLFAQALLIAGKVKEYALFIDKFPNIFNKSQKGATPDKKNFPSSNNPPVFEVETNSGLKEKVVKAFQAVLQKIV